MHPARRLWSLAEPYHAVVYFAPEVGTAFEAVGLRGFWRGDFVGRAAPLGAVGPGVVTACFYGFHPAFVERALPDIWSIAEPEQALAARYRGVDAALRRLLAPDADRPAAEAAALLRDGLEACEPAGRPLYAANASLPWPDDPHLRLWHAVTLLREHRGDGHVATLTAADLDPCEAHATQVAAAGVALDTIQPYRGWVDDDWRRATRRLADRGWIDAAGGLTAAGRSARDAVEADTDRLAAAPIERLGADRLEHLEHLLATVVAPLTERGTIPYPNPIGVPRPQ